MSYPITDIDGIDGEAATILKSVGIRSTERLLEAARTVRGRKMLAMKTGFDEKRLLCWANVADRMRVKGIRKEYAELLQAAGVDTVKELKYRNPANLAKAMSDANKKRKMVRLLPSEKVVGQLDRERQEAAADDQLQIAPPDRDPRLLDSPAPSSAKRPPWGSPAPSKPPPDQRKSQRATRFRRYWRSGGRWSWAFST